MQACGLSDLPLCPAESGRAQSHCPELGGEMLSGDLAHDARSSQSHQMTAERYDQREK